MTAWTNKKLARLKECYRTMTQEQLLAEFAPHSWPSIKTAARGMKLSRRRDWNAIAAAHEPVVFGVKPKAREVVE